MNFRFLTTFLLVLAAFTPLFAQEEEPAETRTLVILGDSLTAGYGLDNPSADAYPALLQKKIDDAKFPWRVINAGISGDTTAGGVRRIKWVLSQKVDLLIIALGGNDGLRGVSPGVTQNNLQSIIDQARATYPEIQIIIAGMQMPANMGAAYTREFREVFPAVAEKNDAKLIPFLLDGVGGRPWLNQPDFIHPTAAGQKILADNVWKVLKPVLKKS